MKTIREFIYKILLRNQKRKALFEAEQDLTYIRKHKWDMLKYDEGKARKRMAELKTKQEKEVLDEKEQIELDTVVDVITESKSTKRAYGQTENLAKELKDYIASI